MRKASTCYGQPKPQPTPQGNAYMVQGWNCFVTSTSTSVTAPSTPSQCAKKENTMDNMEQHQRSQMMERIYCIHEEKNAELRLAFGLRDDDVPRTAEDFIQRIQDGNYVLRAKDGLWGESFYDRVRWRHPDKVEDKAGYKLVNDRLTKAVGDLEDKVNFLPIAESYKAFEEFKATDFATA